ncbi:hypothetical protein BJY01DRAFT_177693 [Aspergillus pseudoustus]|uniref:Uncharacterized protein n=1 Tax=Aspergillus pseudoustus TaxID=1810923 RepID=A0ABR4K029_9EURO
MTMNPYISWAIVLVVAGSLGWYYSETNAKTKSPAKPLLEKTETAPVAKKQKKKAKKSPEPSAAPSEKPAFEFKVPENELPDEEIDQKELAKRFAAVKNGTSSSQFTSGESKSQKKKKGKAAATRQLEPTNGERSASRVSTRTSSTTGAEADDDLSSTGSPQVKATVSAAGYVSDMLEAPAPGASVLRVTGSVDSDSQKKKAKSQNFKQVETKKQRQQRVKNEARKQQVQEAEEQRRKLLEKQLHTAREAERREAAKSTSVPQTNAWQTRDSSKTANGTAPVSQAPKVELLDTFEPVATATSPATSQEYQALPSEEEQMRILGAANGQDAWTTVGTKKPKKKGGKTDESEASASESQPIPSAPTPVEPKVKVTPTYLPDILRSNQKGHPLDSDWAA